MKFDDRLSTLLSAHPTTDAARAALWAQLVDLLAQDAVIDDRKIGERICELASGVSGDRRLAAARAIASRTRSSELVRIFGSDSARIAAPVMLGAILTPLEWQRVIPELAPHARALLRQRRDLPREAQAALLSFGHSDFAIPATPVAEPESLRENTQIRDLMDRIASWREQREAPSPPDLVEVVIAEQFRFEVDAAGAVIWTDSPNRTALIGLSLAETQEARDFGFDAHATGAFAKRAPFKHARLSLVEGRMWGVSGEPVFRDSDGRFLGYRCLARPIVNVGSSDTAQPLGGDAFRQLAHELRTPLNAVHGFAAMIESQMMGPIGQAQRRRAAEIGHDAARILAVIDDVDGWSREVEADGQTDDLAAVMSTVSVNCRSLELERGAKLQMQIDADLPAIALGTATAVRLIQSLARVTLSAAHAGERLTCKVRAGSGVIISLEKSQALLGIATNDLVSESVDEDRKDVLPLGIGFTLRMVRAQARAVGGALDLGGDALVLRLPVADDSAAGASERL